MLERSFPFFFLSFGYVGIRDDRFTKRFQYFVCICKIIRSHSFAYGERTWHKSLCSLQIALAFNSFKNHSFFCNLFSANVGIILTRIIFHHRRRSQHIAISPVFFLSLSLEISQVQFVQLNLQCITSYFQCALWSISTCNPLFSLSLLTIYPCDIQLDRQLNVIYIAI